MIKSKFLLSALIASTVSLSGCTVMYEPREDIVGIIEVDENVLELSEYYDDIYVMKSKLLKFYPSDRLNSFRVNLDKFEECFYEYMGDDFMSEYNVIVKEFNDLVGFYKNSFDYSNLDIPSHYHYTEDMEIELQDLMGEVKSSCDKLDFITALSIDGQVKRLIDSNEYDIGYYIWMTGYEPVYPEN